VSDQSTQAQKPATTSSVISDEAWSNASSTWVNNHVRNSPISGAVEAWNHLGAVLPLLRNYLETELGKKE
jgi:hypothetical protein